MQPAGTTLQAKDSLPIRESRVRLEDFVAVSALFWNSAGLTTCPQKAGLPAILCQAICRAMVAVSWGLQTFLVLQPR